MLTEMQDIKGKALTVTGPVEPAAFGQVTMHEHLHSDCYDWEADRLVDEEKPISPDRRKFLMEEAVPYLKRCNEYGCHGYIEVTPPPWRAWPTFYVEASRTAGIYIVLCTGVYGEMNDNEYWVKRESDKLWSFARNASEDKLADYFTREIAEGIHGTGVRAGAIKLGTRNPVNKPVEDKCLRAGARAQQATGVHITTHCTQFGSETSQLTTLDMAGTDLSRVVIGHTAWHLMDTERRKICLDWMRRGANFMPTNLAIGPDGGERWRPLIEAIHDVFDAGLGDRLVFGLDCAFCSEGGPLKYCVMPPPPFIYMWEHTLPAFRAMGLTTEEEDWIMRRNPQRIIPVQ